MKINKVYDYQDLTRIDGKKRLYATPGGAKVPSVTTILDATSDKTHLIAWRQRVGEDKARADRERDRPGPWQPDR